MAVTQGQPMMPGQGSSGYFSNAQPINYPTANGQPGDLNNRTQYNQFGQQQQPYSLQQLEVNDWSQRQAQADRTAQQQGQAAPTLAQPYTTTYNPDGSYKGVTANPAYNPSQYASSMDNLALGYQSGSAAPGVQSGVMDQLTQWMKQTGQQPPSMNQLNPSVAPLVQQQWGAIGQLIPTNQQQYFQPPPSTGQPSLTSAVTGAPPQQTQAAPTPPSQPPQNAQQQGAPPVQNTYQTSQQPPPMQPGAANPTSLPQPTMPANTQPINANLLTSLVNQQNAGATGGAVQQNDTLRNQTAAQGFGARSPSLIGQQAMNTGAGRGQVMQNNLNMPLQAAQLNAAYGLNLGQL